MCVGGVWAELSFRSDAPTFCHSSSLGCFHDAGLKYDGLLTLDFHGLSCCVLRSLREWCRAGTSAVTVARVT